MGQTIYVDTLVCTNLFINYFLLLATAKFLSLRAHRLRLLAAGLLGGAYSLSILLPRGTFPLPFLVKILMAVTIVALAFAPINLRLFAKILALFFIMSFLFAGLVFFMWHFFAPSGVFVQNGMVYFDISPMFLTCATLVSYFVLRFSGRFLSRVDLREELCQVEIGFSGKRTVINAKIDTGNVLCEPFSMLPVVVVELEYIREILPQQAIEALSLHQSQAVQKNTAAAVGLSFRLVPAGTVAGEKLLPAFRPERFVVLQKRGASQKDVYVAICDGQFSKERFGAIVGSQLLE